jgi:hypothetical protein
MRGAFPQCVFCPHQDAGPRSRCAAFPRQIPDTILRYQFDHREPWRGGSITFAPKADVPDELLEQLSTTLDRLS